MPDFEEARDKHIAMVARISVTAPNPLATPKKIWVRVALFFSTIPIAIVANSFRVTFTGVLTQYKPELAEGFFHSASGWVIFMVALGIMIAMHRLLVWGGHLLRRGRVTP